MREREREKRPSLSGLSAVKLIRKLLEVLRVVSIIIPMKSHCILDHFNLL